MSSLKQQRHHHDTAYESINAAIDLENIISTTFASSNGSSSSLDAIRRNALQLYETGLNEMEAALAVQHSSEYRTKANVLNEKMRKNIGMVRDRIDALRKNLGIEQQSSSITSSRTSTLASSPIVARKPRKATSMPLRPSVKKEPVRTRQDKEVKKDEGQAQDDAFLNQIRQEILIEKPNVTWSDVTGLESAKQALQELVVLPSLRPDLYSGLRAPPRGVMLFGPPGTGKTMLAKALAHESGARFLAISASSLTSKFLGESEKLVRALFALARQVQPAIIFLDEADSILSARKSEGEHEASRRLKTEFLLQFDGIASGTSTETDRVFVLAATNRPQELDEAVRRRFTKRIYICLPDAQTRSSLLRHLLKNHSFNLSEKELEEVVKITDGYSCSDLTAVAKEAALLPLRDFSPQQLVKLDSKKIRPISKQDFIDALKLVRRSVAPSEIEAVEKWARDFGCAG